MRKPMDQRWGQGGESGRGAKPRAGARIRLGSRAWPAALGWAVLLLGAGRAHTQQSQIIVDPKAAQLFATLPTSAKSPEGITADASGNLFVGTFNMEMGGKNFLLRLDGKGQVSAQVDVGSLPLLGIEFNRRDGKIYLLAVGGLSGKDSKVRRVAANFGPMTAIEDVAVVPDLPAPKDRIEMGLNGALNTIRFGKTGSVPNGLVFREGDGALFFSDSGQGAIFKIADPTQPSNICPTSTTCVDTVLQDGRLATAGNPPFGANGVAFSRDASTLFIANTGDDRVLKLDLAGNAGLSILAEDINGADGLRAGPGNTLFVAANRADQVVILNEMTGQVLAELGAFLGTGPNGAPTALSVPASVVQVGNAIFVTNLGARAGLTQAMQLFTVSRIAVPTSILQAGMAAASGRN
jgi:hypothetical protein